MLMQRLAHQPARQLFTQPSILPKYFPPAASAISRLPAQKRWNPPCSTPHSLLKTIYTWLTLSSFTSFIAFPPSSSPPKTTPAKPSDAYTILAKQRLNRPVAPHLTIYRPQLTWLLSGLNRITGSILSGGFYIFGAAYLVSPAFGWHLESASLAEWFGGFGPVTKFLVKFGVALPFCFHSFNGVRHLVWDTGRELATKQVIRTGWVVIGLTVVCSGALAYI